mmetsp:Transcript_10812/g.24721  ORF Transcript_10812/g.24721 Transcript_10812/m.24721 type:complete len:221 (+) Transcript_10812:91-753(+)
MSAAAQLRLLFNEEQASKKRDASLCDGFSDVSEDEAPVESKNGPTRFGLRRQWLLKEKKLLAERKQREEEMLRQREEARQAQADNDSDDGSAMSDIDSNKDGAEDEDDSCGAEGEGQPAISVRSLGSEEDPQDCSPSSKNQAILGLDELRTSNISHASAGSWGDDTAPGTPAGSPLSPHSPCGSAASAVRVLRRSNLKKPTMDGTTSPPRMTPRVSFRDD